MINFERRRVGRGQNFIENRVERYGAAHGSLPGEFGAPEQEIHRQPEQRDEQKKKARAHGGSPR